MPPAVHLAPLPDPRWPEFLDRHPAATVFHTPGWLEALRLTYGYEPGLLTTAGLGEELTNGLPFCRIRSWLTGRRTVSLPFSDHCGVLAAGEEDAACLVAALQRDVVAGGARYVELRPLTPPSDSLGWQPSERFCLHQLDLRPGLDQIFHSLHKNCVQRKIRRAERERLRCVEGVSQPLLAAFHRLLVLTRRRHNLPPHPMAWFTNLAACMGPMLKVSIALNDQEPVAGILTLRFKSTVVYKYGCLDRGFANLGGMHLLLWKTIQDAKREGLLALDLGRSDWDDPGLTGFKDRWGARRSVLTYWRYPAPHAPGRLVKSAAFVARQLLARSPDPVLIAAGKLLYRHAG